MSKIRNMYLLSMSALLLPLQASALSDAEIESKLQQYESRIKMMEAELAAKPSATTSSAPSSSSTSSQEDKLRINGFVSAGANYSEDDLNRFGLEGETNFRGLSKAGVQLSYQLNEKADATIQMVAKTADSGDDAWRVEAEWAYLGYKLTDDLKVRAGRLRIPFYMYSESLDVGYSYPWVRPPLEVYRSPLTAYDGIDLTYDFRVAGVNNRLQTWAGAYKDTSDLDGKGGNDDVVLKDSYGVNLSSTVGDFTARAMFYTTTIDGTVSSSATFTTAPFNVAASVCGIAFSTASACSATSGFVRSTPAVFVDFTTEAEDDLDYASLGFQWDNGKFFVTAETTDLKAQDGLFFTDEKGGYVTAGTRVQDWTPYASYGWSYSTNEQDFANKRSVACAGGTTAKTCSSQSKSVSFGTRKELGENMSLTMQWDRYFDFNDTNGFFAFSASEGWDQSDAYTISLDAVF